MSDVFPYPIFRRLVFPFPLFFAGDHDDDCKGTLKCYQRTLGWTKMRDGECTQGLEIIMYEGKSDNPGTDAVSRAKECAKACISKKSPSSGSQTWTGFHAKGFIVQADGSADSNLGRCFCENVVSKESGCSLTSNAYDRYDFDKVPGCDAGGSGDISSYDYCYDATQNTELKSSGKTYLTEANPGGLCEGTLV